jgi:glycine/D-amino acid oxidase-like deaminating enzyme
MANKRGMIVQTRPVQTRIHHILMTPDVHFRQNPDGSLVAGEIFSGDLDQLEDAPALADTVIARIRQKLRGQPDVQPAQVKLGERPVPMDGLPVVGAVPGVPGVFVAVMHSGVTLGPLIGQLLANEILQGRSSPLMSSFRASRFAGA